MNTTENNKIIAKFMGITFTTYNAGTKELYIKDEIEYFKLLYQYDWNWLMEVVEKIESLGFKTSIENGFCSIDTNEIYFETKDFNPTKIQTTFNVCVEFIKWYNEQNK